MYKMAVLDIDGTLVDDNGRIPNANRRAIRLLQEKGVIVTICTGRNIKKTLPVVQKAGILVPFSCIDGTLLYDPVREQVIQDYRLFHEEVKILLDIVRGRHAFVEINDGHFYYKYSAKEELFAYDIFNRRDTLGRIKSHLGGVRYVKEFDRLYAVADPVYQLVIAANTQVLEEIKAEIQASSLQNLELRDYLWEQYLFINRAGVQKSRGMENLCHYFGITPEETVAMGDERNDMDMLTAAGMGVAMGNALDEVKALANHITASNNDGGVAAALAHFFLKEEQRLPQRRGRIGPF